MAIREYKVKITSDESAFLKRYKNLRSKAQKDSISLPFDYSEMGADAEEAIELLQKRIRNKPLAAKIIYEINDEELKSAGKELDTLREKAKKFSSVSSDIKTPAKITGNIKALTQELKAFDKAGDKTGIKETVQEIYQYADAVNKARKEANQKGGKAKYSELDLFGGDYKELERLIDKNDKILSKINDDYAFGHLPKFEINTLGLERTVELLEAMKEKIHKIYGKDVELQDWGNYFKKVDTSKIEQLQKAFTALDKAKQDLEASSTSKATKAAFNAKSDSIDEIMGLLSVDDTTEAFDKITNCLDDAKASLSDYIAVFERYLSLDIADVFPDDGVAATAIETSAEKVADAGKVTEKAQSKAKAAVNEVTKAATAQKEAVKDAVKEEEAAAEDLSAALDEALRRAMHDAEKFDDTLTSTKEKPKPEKPAVKASSASAPEPEAPVPAPTPEKTRISKSDVSRTMKDAEAAKKSAAEANDSAITALARSKQAVTDAGDALTLARQHDKEINALDTRVKTVEIKEAGTESEVEKVKEEQTAQGNTVEGLKALVKELSAGVDDSTDKAIIDLLSKIQGAMDGLALESTQKTLGTEGTLSSLISELKAALGPSDIKRSLTNIVKVLQGMKETITSVSVATENIEKKVQDRSKDLHLPRLGEGAVPLDPDHIEREPLKEDVARRKTDTWMAKDDAGNAFSYNSYVEELNNGDVYHKDGKGHVKHITHRETGEVGALEKRLASLSRQEKMLAEAIARRNNEIEDPSVDKAMTTLLTEFEALTKDADALGNVKLNEKLSSFSEKVNLDAVKKSNDLIRAQNKEIRNTVESERAYLNAVSASEDANEEVMSLLREQRNELKAIDNYQRKRSQMDENGALKPYSEETRDYLDSHLTSITKRRKKIEGLLSDADLQKKITSDWDEALVQNAAFDKERLIKSLEPVFKSLEAQEKDLVTALSYRENGIKDKATEKHYHALLSNFDYFTEKSKGLQNNSFDTFTGKVTQEALKASNKLIEAQNRDIQETVESERAFCNEVAASSAMSLKLKKLLAEQREEIKALYKIGDRKSIRSESGALLPYSEETRENIAGKKKSIAKRHQEIEELETFNADWDEAIKENQVFDQKKSVERLERVLSGFQDRRSELVSALAKKKIGEKDPTSERSDTKLLARYQKFLGQAKYLNDENLNKKVSSFDQKVTSSTLKAQNVLIEKRTKAIERSVQAEKTYAEKVEASSTSGEKLDDLLTKQKKDLKEIGNIISHHSKKSDNGSLLPYSEKDLQAIDRLLSSIASRKDEIKDTVAFYEDWDQAIIKNQQVDAETKADFNKAWDAAHAENARRDAAKKAKEDKLWQSAYADNATFDARKKKHDDAMWRAAYADNEKYDKRQAALQENAASLKDLLPTLHEVASSSERYGADAEKLTQEIESVTKATNKEVTAFKQRARVISRGYASETKSHEKDVALEQKEKERAVLKEIISLEKQRKKAASEDPAKLSSIEETISARMKALRQMDKDFGQNFTQQAETAHKAATGAITSSAEKRFLSLRESLKNLNFKTSAMNPEAFGEKQLGNYNQAVKYLDEMAGALKEVAENGDFASKNVQELLNKASTAGKSATDSLKALNNFSDKMVPAATVGKSIRDLNGYLNNTGASADFLKRVRDLRDELSALQYQDTETKKSISSQIPVSEWAATYKNELVDLQAESKKAENQGMRLLDQIGASLRSKNAQFISYFLSIWDIIRYVREATDVIKQYDSALIEMEKVSDETASSLERFAKQSFDIADSVGTSGLQIEKSTADFMRLGESLGEASENASLANTLMNVSEFDNIEDATTALISMEAAYKDLSGERIINSLNRVGNEYAISTSGIATALQDSAAALTTAKVDFDEAVGLTTAANTIVQDPDQVGKGIRTIALRLTGTKEAKQQLSDMGEEVDDFVVQTQSKLDASVRNLTRTATNPNGISLFGKNGQYDIYDFLQRLADSWDEIAAQDEKNGTQAQNALLEMLAGKNRASILGSILESPDVLRNATEASMNAEGSAAKELSTYMDSIEAHQEKFKNSVEELVTDLVKSGTINEIIDLGTKFVNVLDTIVNKLGGIQTITGGLAQYALLFTHNGDFNFGKNIFDAIDAGKAKKEEGVKASIRNFYNANKANGDVAALTAEKFPEYSASIKEFAATTDGASIAVKDITKNASDMGPVLSAVGTTAKSVGKALAGAFLTTAVITGVELLGTALYHLATANREATKAANEAAGAHNEETAKLSDYEEKITSLRETIENESSTYEEVSSAKKDLYDIQDDLIKTYGSEAENLDLVNGNLKEQIRLMQKLSAEKAASVVSKAKTPTKDQKIKGEIGYAINQSLSHGAYTGDVHYDTAYDQMMHDVAEKQDYSFDVASSGLSEKDLKKVLSVIKDIHGVTTDITDNALHFNIEAKNAYALQEKVKTISEAVADSARATIANPDDAQAFIDTVSNGMQKAIDEVSEKISSNEELLIAAGQNAIETNVTETDEEGHTYQEMLAFVNEASEAYQNALDQGNEDLEESTKDTLVSTIGHMYEVAAQNNNVGILKYLESAYQTIWDEISKWRFSDAWEDTSEKKKKSVSKAAAALKASGLSNDEIINGDHLSKNLIKARATLKDAASDVHMTLSDFVTGLSEEGMLLTKAQSDFLSSLPQDTIRKRLSALSYGGNVDLQARAKMKPVDYKTMTKAGWSGFEEGDIASTYTATFESRQFDIDGPNIAMNLTPILTDKDGNVIGVLSPETLEKYASFVLNGGDDKTGTTIDGQKISNIKIGETFTGPNALENADHTAQLAHDYQALASGIDITDDELKEVSDDLAKTTGAMKEQSAATVGSASALSTLKSEMGPTMSALGEAYKSIFEGGKDEKSFDIKNVTMDQLEEVSKAVDSLNKDLSDKGLSVKVDSKDVDQLINTLGDAKTTKDEAQKAFNDFATSIADTVIPQIDGLDTASQAAMEQTLTEMGVTNAEDVLLSRVSMSASELAEAKRDAAAANIATDGDIKNLGSLDVKAIASNRTLLRYISAKIRAGQVTISTSGDIANLIAIANAANMGTAAISRLAEAKSLMATAEQRRDAGYTDFAWKPLYEAAQRISSESLDKFGYTEVTSHGGTAKNKTSGGGKGGGKGSSSKKDFEEKVDWVERAQKALSDNLTDIQGVIDDTFDDWGARLDHIGKKYGNLTRQIDLSKKAMNFYLKQAASVGLAETYAAKVRAGQLQIEKFKNEAEYKKIEEYKEYYDNYVKYEQQYNDLIRQRTALISNQLDMIAGSYEDISEDCDHIIEMAGLEQETGDVVARINSDITKRGATERELNNLIKERAALQKALSTYTGDKNSEGYHDLFKRLNECDEKAHDLRVNLQSIAKEKFDNVASQFDHIATSIDHIANRLSSISDIVTATGYYASRKVIEVENQIAEAQRQNLIKRRDALQKELSHAVQNHTVIEGSEAWFEMKNEIDDCTDSIMNQTAEIEKNRKELRQWAYDAEDYIAARTHRVFDLNKFLTEELSADSLYEKNGGWKDTALATQGLYASNYAMYMAEAKRYGQEIKKINEELAVDPANADLIARRETLIDQQRQMIEGAESEKKSIQDLVKNGYDKFLSYLQDLIEKRKQALEAEQSLYEYEKDIKEQTKEISSYEKQLAALSGDTSEETQLRKQQLKNNLKQSKEALREKEYDRWKQDQEEMMGNMYQAFEDLINDRVEDIKGLLSTAIDMTAANAGTITGTIQSAANTLGIDLMSSMNVIGNGQLQMSAQFASIASDIASQNSTVTSILYSQGDLVTRAGDALAEKINGEDGTALSDVNSTLQAILRELQNIKTKPTTPDYESVHSVYDPNSGNHLFTSNEEEINNLVKQGWENEGVKFKSGKTGKEVFRVYNPHNGDHLLTINTTEANNLVKLGWRKEPSGIKDSGEGIPVYRVYNPNSGLHYFTTSTDNVSKLVSLGWRYEEIAFHSLKAGTFAKGGTVGNAIKSTGEDGIILARTGEEVLSLEKIREMQKVLALFQPLSALTRTSARIPAGKSEPRVTVGNITTNLSLPNVTNYQDFINEAKADPKFEQLVQQLTLGNVLGKSPLKKLSI